MGQNPAKVSEYTAPFSALAAQISEEYMALLNQVNQRAPLPRDLHLHRTFRSFYVGGLHYPLETTAYLEGDWKAVLTYPSRRRGARGAPADPPQLRVNEVGELRQADRLAGVLMEALRQIDPDIVVYNLCLMKNGELTQLYHRDVASTEADGGCATLIWAVDGPRDVGCVEMDPDTGDLSETVVRLEMGHALLQHYSSIHRGLGSSQGAAPGSTSFFFYILKPHGRQKGRNWMENLVGGFQGWPLVDGIDALRAIRDSDPLLSKGASSIHLARDDPHKTGRTKSTPAAASSTAGASSSVNGASSSVNAAASSTAGASSSVNGASSSVNAAASSKPGASSSRGGKKPASRKQPASNKPASNKAAKTQTAKPPASSSKAPDEVGDDVEVGAVVEEGEEGEEGEEDVDEETRKTMAAAKRACHECLQLNNECPLCKEDMDEYGSAGNPPFTTVCNHKFHLDCLLSMMQQPGVGDRCPICRVLFSSEEKRRADEAALQLATWESKRKAANDWAEDNPPVELFTAVPARPDLIVKILEVNARWERLNSNPGGGIPVRMALQTLLQHEQVTLLQRYPFKGLKKRYKDIMRCAAVPDPSA